MIPHRRPAAALAALLLLVAACGSSNPATPTPAASGARSSVPSAAATAAPGSACAPAATPVVRDWNERVWYEVFVRSFADGNGDGIGDLRGLTARLDYLNDGNPATTTDLGVAGLWLMPVAEAASYHGYDVIDERKVEQDYGTSADFRALIAAAHQRGIKVIVDLVLNHTSNKNPWFVDSQIPGSAHDGWYIWATENPHYLGPDGQVVWHPLGKRWFYGVFSEAMPDLNLRNPEVTAELTDMARFWLQDMGVDGFRLDAAKHLIEDGKVQTNTPETLAWLSTFHTAVEAAKPGSLLVGEVWDPASIAGRYVPDSLDMTFDFGLATAVRLAIQNKRAAPLATAFSDSLAAWPPDQQATFLTNHDQDRIMSQLYDDLPSARLAAFMLLTEPGVPFIYYGEEIGMTGRKPDEQIRTPMRWTEDPVTAGFSTAAPWEALSDDAPSVSVASETGDPHSLLSTYRDLIAIRNANVALREGVATIVDGGAEPVIGWLRTTPDQALLTIVNTSDQPVDAYGLSLAAGPICGAVGARLVGTVGGDPAAAVTAPAVTADGGFDQYRPLTELAPRSGYVIELRPQP